MQIKYFKCACLVGVLAFSNSLSAEPLELAAQLEYQLRYFNAEPQWPGQDFQRAQSAVAGKLELRWQSEDSSQRVAVVPYGRYDEIDSERNLLDLQEAYWALRFNDYELLLGGNQVFWGVTESVHLVDIVNQTDVPADVDGEQKLGQTMVNFAVQKDWGLLSMYVLPGFRERQFPGEAGRLRFPFVISNEESYESDQGQAHVDYAVRYSQFLGDFDVGLSAFNGTNREPQVIAGTNPGTFTLYYEQMSQVGLDLQYTREAWLWKLETLWRDSAQQTFWAAVAGFEYTHYQMFGSQSDIGFLLEYQYDGRDQSITPTPADNDIFLGTRITLNDMQDTAILAALVYDHETEASLVNVEAERRFGESIIVEFRLRAFNGTQEPDILNVYSHDDYAQISVQKYF